MTADCFLKVFLSQLCATEIKYLFFYFLILVSFPLF